MKYKKTKAFTLVELMVVMGVILILAGSMFLVGPAISRKNAEAKTKATMKNVDNLLTRYYLEYKNYPLSIRRGANAAADRNTEPTYTPFYLSKDKSLDEGGNDDDDDIGIQKYISGDDFAGSMQYDEAAEASYVVDGFGTALVYYCADDTSYRLISLGANGLIGTGKDDSGKEFSKMVFSADGKQHDEETGEEMIKAQYMTFAYEGQEDYIHKYFGQGDDIVSLTGSGY